MAENTPETPQGAEENVTEVTETPASDMTNVTEEAETEDINETDEATDTVAIEEAAENAVTATTPVNIQTEPVAVETIDPEHADYPAPTGAFAFVILMILFYIVYWAVGYIEIFIVRGVN